MWTVRFVRMLVNTRVTWCQRISNTNNKDMHYIIIYLRMHLRIHITYKEQRCMALNVRITFLSPSQRQCQRQCDERETQKQNTKNRYNELFAMQTTANMHAYARISNQYQHQIIQQMWAYTRAFCTAEYTTMQQWLTALVNFMDVPAQSEFRFALFTIPFCSALFHSTLTYDAFI